MQLAKDRRIILDLEETVEANHECVLCGHNPTICLLWENITEPLP